MCHPSVHLHNHILLCVRSCCRFLTKQIPFTLYFTSYMTRLEMTRVKTVMVTRFLVNWWRLLKNKDNKMASATNIEMRHNEWTHIECNKLYMIVKDRVRYNILCNYSCWLLGFARVPYYAPPLHAICTHTCHHIQ